MILHGVRLIWAVVCVFGAARVVGVFETWARPMARGTRGSVRRILPVVALQCAARAHGCPFSKRFHLLLPPADRAGHGASSRRRISALGSEYVQRISALCGAPGRGAVSTDLASCLEFSRVRAPNPYVHRVLARGTVCFGVVSRLGPFGVCFSSGWHTVCVWLRTRE